MKTYARIQNGLGVELINVADNLVPGKDIFTPDFASTLVQGDGKAAIGWTYDGKKLSAPVVPDPTSEDLLAYAASKRFSVETGGISVNGSKIATDRASQSLITGAYSYVLANPSETVKFKTASGSFVELTAAQMTAIANAVGAHVQSCFSAEEVVSAAIASGTIKAFADIDAASWPTNA